MSLRPIELRAQLFRPGPSGQVSASEVDRSLRALSYMLDGMVQASADWILCHPDTPSLYDSHVLYRGETQSEIWQDIPTTLMLGYGDCEDLTIYRCADLRAREGVDAMPHITGRRVGSRRIYHATVEWPNGMIEDPSRALGMHGHPITRSPVFI